MEQLSTGDTELQHKNSASTADNIKNIIPQNFALMSWLSSVMPLAEFLLLLMAIVIFIEIAPSDIPAKCDTKLQQACLEEYLIAGGPNAAYESSLTDNNCGTSRVACWRSGIKDMIYDGSELPPETTSVNIDHLSLPPLVKQHYRGAIEYCICLLSDNYTLPLPQSPEVWRSDTRYFCEILERINQGIGLSGLVLACATVSIKSIIEAEEYNIKNTLFAVFLIVVFWLGWSTAVVILVSDYAAPEQKTDCEMPDSNIFYYVWVIGVLSMLGALYAGLIVGRVLYKVLTGKMQ